MAEGIKGLCITRLTRGWNKSLGALTNFVFLSLSLCAVQALVSTTHTASDWCIPRHTTRVDTALSSFPSLCKRRAVCFRKVKKTSLAFRSSFRLPFLPSPDTRNLAVSSSLSFLFPTPLLLNGPIFQLFFLLLSSFQCHPREKHKNSAH